MLALGVHVISDFVPTGYQSPAAPAQAADEAQRRLPTPRPTESLDLLYPP